MTPKNITYYESQADWLDDKHGCGATTAYRLLAACPSSWGGPWTEWAKAHYPGWENPHQTTAMGAGLTWEQYVLSWYDDHHIEGNDNLHLDVQTCRIEASDFALPLRPSPDALVWDDDTLVGGVEVKCPRYGWDDYAKDGTVIETWATTLEPGTPMAKGWLGRRREEYPAPLHYVVQVYTTMIALRRAGHDVQWYDLVVCFGPHDTRVIRFQYDEAVAQELLRLLSEAWQDIVVEGNEPTPDETRQAWDYLLTRPRKKGPVRLDPVLHTDLAQDVVDYVQGHAQDSKWQKTKKALRVGILDSCTQYGTEALEVEALDKVYRVKVTATGRFYPRLIISKKDD